MIGGKKLGRPSSTEKRERLEVISFKADAETREAIEQIELWIGGGNLRGKRSLAIRRAVLELRDRISRPSK